MREKNRSFLSRNARAVWLRNEASTMAPHTKQSDARQREQCHGTDVPIDGSKSPTIRRVIRHSLTRSQGRTSTAIKREAWTVPRISHRSTPSFRIKIPLRHDCAWRKLITNPYANENGKIHFYFFKINRTSLYQKQQNSSGWAVNRHQEYVTQEQRIKRYVVNEGKIRKLREIGPSDEKKKVQKAK